MITPNLPISVRSSGCSKFTLMKNNPKDSRLQFFKRNSNLTYQSDLNQTKTRQVSKNQTKSIQKDKSLGINVRNEKVIMKASLNRTKKEIDELAPSLNTKLIKLFKTLDLVKKKTISSTNRTTYEKSQEKKPQQLSPKGNNINTNTTINLNNNNRVNDVNSKSIIINHVTTRSKKKTSTNTNANNTNNDSKQKEFLAAILNNQMINTLKAEKPKPFSISTKAEDNLMKQSNAIGNNAKSKSKSKSKDKEIKTFNPFNLGYMKTTKPNQSLKAAALKQNKTSQTNQYLYLSTNQSNIQNHHNSNRTIEQIYSLRPSNKAQQDIKWVNTTGDYYSSKQGDKNKNGNDNDKDNYESDSNDFIRDEDDSEDKEEDSGVLAYEDVKDIIVYNDFNDLSQSNCDLFDSHTYDDFIRSNKDTLALRFFNNKDNRKEHKSPSTNESSHNKKNHVNIIKYYV